jgi:protein dithiol oxidoreductase (disulfide-forming)
MSRRRAFIACAVSLAGLALVGVSNAAPAKSPWQAGVNYRLMPDPVPPTVASGKVEVTEVFWYGCGHCFALDPVLEEWNARKASYIEFVRVPVIWGPVHRQHAKLFYTLQALRRPELHAKVFEAIHREGMAMSAREDLQARALQMAFLAQHGVTEQQFNAAYDSMTVAMNVQRADNYTRALAIDNVPSIFINGKIATSVSEAGGEAQLLKLIDDLAASEKR